MSLIKVWYPSIHPLVTMICMLICSSQADYWSDWSNWSLCSRTCGGGSSYRLRKCIPSFIFQYDCQGEAIQYVTCNNEQCPNPKDNFRAQQCSAYDDNMYFGQYFTWIPYRNPSDPCSLYCLAVEGNIVKSLAPKVLDGTRCDTQNLDICINGQCWNVGCDHVLNSDLQMDQCGVCGGNNTCVKSTETPSTKTEATTNDSISKLDIAKDDALADDHQLSIEHEHQREQEQQQQSPPAINESEASRKKKFSKKYQYEWIVRFSDLCSVTCSVGVYQSRSLCRDIRRDMVVAQELCANVPKVEPPDTKPCYMKACPPRWEAKEWQPCTRTCGGGASLREVRCMEYGSMGQARWVNDRYCKQYKPSEYKSCNTEICPRWYAGEWSPCSVTCGFGVQQRVVICRNSGNKPCDDKVRPALSQTCTTNLPCFQRSGDIQESVLTDYRKSSPPKYGLPPNISKDDLSTPRFISYDWSPCSATYGTGVKTRRVTCNVLLQFVNEVTEVPERECIEAGLVKPRDTMECQAGVRPGHGSEASSDINGTSYTMYVWKLKDFAFHSENNVKDKQILRLACYDAGLGSEVNRSYCTSQPILYFYHKWCSTEAVCYGWYYLDEYTPCQPTCGNSSQQRLVECVEENTQQPDQHIFYAVPGKFCMGPMPQMLKSCTSADTCQASWGLSPWEKCSVTCHGGIQRRTITCQKTLPDGSRVSVSDAECADIPRARSVRVCNSFPCQWPKIREPVWKFFQLTQLDHVNLFTGSQAYILPGTALHIRCLTRGIDRNSIMWLRNNQSMDTNSSDVNQPTYKSRQRIFIRTFYNVSGSMNYTCKTETFHNNVTNVLSSTLIVYFINLADILPAKDERGLYLPSVPSLPYPRVTDPYDKVRRRVQYVPGKWSPCTARVCKRYGRQERNVSCEIITSQYIEELPPVVCKKANLKRPEKIRKCRTDCFKWITYDWSKCIPRRCVRDYVSIQKRRIVCYNSMTRKITRRRYCKHLKTPPLQRECHTPLCESYWKTSAWSKCRGKCGDLSYQIRFYWCHWRKTDLFAEKNCNLKPRPMMKRACRVPPCKLGGTNQ